MQVYMTEGPQNNNADSLSFECESYLKVRVGKAYDKMAVNEGVLCEDRSLNVHTTRGQTNKDTSCENQSESADVEKELQSLSLDESTEATNQTNNRHPLEELFEVLIGSVESNLTEEEIVIVPQGSLYLVPFAALRNPTTGKYLYETKRIRLAPSIVALKTLQECPADYHIKTGALVIGNPEVGEVIFKGGKCEFGSLPNAKVEANLVGNRLKVTPLLGSQATKEEVKKRLAEGVAVIHIAAHGDSRNGEIALAPSESAKQKGIPEEKDYMLTMKEVQEIGVRAKLVVLSCCHSGCGDIEAEGVVGMSRAFLAAGARSVVASLWAINDEITLCFMVPFYDNLKAGRSVSVSLQNAMQAVRDYGFEEPKFWAPFFLLGEDVTIF